MEPAGGAPARRFAVDFVGGSLDGLTEEATIDVSLSTLAGAIEDVRAEPLPDGTGWRASFVVTPEGDRPADMRLILLADDEPVTETWTYVWYPEDTR